MNSDNHEIDDGSLVLDLNILPDIIHPLEEELDEEIVYVHPNSSLGKRKMDKKGDLIVKPKTTSALWQHFKVWNHQLTTGSGGGV